MGIIEGGIVALLSAIGGWFGGFFGSYFKKKGENLATKEDFNDLREQTRQIAQATKEIESRIDDQVWNRQRHWEMKRDAFMSVISSLGRADDALMALATAYEVAEKSISGEWKEIKSETMSAFDKEISKYDEKRFEAVLVCGHELDFEMRKAGRFIRDAASKVFKKQISSYGEVAEPIQKAILRVVVLCRMELGISVHEFIKPLSDEASAAQGSVSES